MKLKAIAGAAALGLLATVQAQAFAPTDAPDFVFYTGGGSAQGAAFLAFAQKLMTSFDTYTDVACGTQGANYRAVYGTMAATLPDGSAMPATLAGKKVFIEYGNNGGTFANGINGLARSVAIPFVNYINAQGTNNTTACATGAGGTNYTTAATGTPTVANRVPLVGMSDEEVTLFSGTNLPAATTALTATELTKIATFPLFVNVFGVAETNALALQKKNFSKFELTAIEAGLVTNWNQLKGDVGAFAGVSLPSGPIVFMDRNSGSGSKAAWNQYFLHNPGSKAFGGQLAPKVSTGGNVGDCTNYTVYSDCPKSSNGNVKAGLNDAQSKATPVRAVGLLGLEFQPAGTDGYQFGNVNGVDISGTTAVTCGNAVANPFEPANVVSGAHDLAFTNSVQFRTANVGGQPFNGDGSASSDFMDAFIAAASDPKTEVSVPGVLLDPDVAGTPPTGGTYDACIMRGTRHQNSTAPLQLVF